MRRKREKVDEHEYKRRVNEREREKGEYLEREEERTGKRE